MHTIYVGHRYSLRLSTDRLFGLSSPARCHELTTRQIEPRRSSARCCTRRGIADPARIGTMGVSYGGFMSAWLVTQDQRFKAAVAGSPVTEWYSFTFTTNIPRWGLWFLDHADPEGTGNQLHTRSPVMHASKARTPTLPTAGAQDPG